MEGQRNETENENEKDCDSKHEMDEKKKRQPAGTAAPAEKNWLEGNANVTAGVLSRLFPIWVRECFWNKHTDWIKVGQ